jgi:predicted Zn finger-like uncharacterized protein
MKIVCDACQAKYSIADDKIQGKAFKIRCKKCNHIIVVKTGGDSASAAPASGPVAVEKPRATSSAPVAEQGVWHVVIDGEQVGPLTDAEVKDRLRQGKINSDTLVWKEGFADWMQLSTVPELSALLARITQHPIGKQAVKEPMRATSSARPIATTPVPPTDEPDPFAAATVVTPSSTADLFASLPAPSAVPSPVGPSPSSPFLFGGASTQPAEPVVAKTPGNGAGTTHLTGQRNENSVLFSLSNLEALAVPSQSGGGIRPPSSTSNTEGSGLIDIRSMAAMTLNEGAGESRRSSDALPTFSTPQFSPVAPVLLPMSTSGPPKWVYPVMGLLAVGILVLGYGIYKVVTAPPPGTPPPVVVVPAPTPVPTAPQQPVAVPSTGASAATATESAKPSTTEEKKDVAGTEKPAEKDKGKPDKGKSYTRKSSDTSSASKGTTTRSSSSPSSPPTSEPTATTKTPTSGKKPGGGGKSIDDMLGEVGSKRSDEGSKAAPTVKLITLTQSDIVTAMKGVQPKVQACANQFKAPGTAMATISVASGGRVSSATVTGKFAGTPTGSCVEQAAKSAKFPSCQSMSFPWPFTLSPR